MLTVLRENDSAIFEMQEPNNEHRQRRLLLGVLLVLLALLASVNLLFVRYLMKPAPLPELLPLPMGLNLEPHYLFSIHGVENPIGVTLSPEGDRIYVTESGGDRRVKVFDRDGDLVGSFAPPRTKRGERSPVYLSTDSTGRVYVTDRLQHAVFVYDREGNYLDTILNPDLTLSEYVSDHLNGLPSDITYVYNAFEPYVYYWEPGEEEQTLPAPESSGWAPLGIHIDEEGGMLLTDVAADQHAVHVITGDMTRATFWQDLDPTVSTFGAYGQGSGNFIFPNRATIDSKGRIYVTDSNNGRVSVWDREGHHLFTFGLGSSDEALSLPRGVAIDTNDYLYVVDTVGQCVKVFDVSDAEPYYLFAFGSWGLGDGQFNFPNDVAVSASGRIYVADRENDRIQVWLY